jgi:anaerobic magnesium-protoporphyrin IX monomethyl ester cyclase
VTHAVVSYQPSKALRFSKVLFAFCPTGAYCREDRCQSFFKFELIPSMRAPLEECEAAGAVSVLGAQHEIVDGPAEKLTETSFLQRVVSSGADLVCLAVTFGSLEADLKWAARIKEILPSLTIGLRGAPCYVWAEKILRTHASVDFCLEGDYEVAFASLLQHGLDGAVGVTSRRAGGLIVRNPPEFVSALDELPLPDRSRIKPNLYQVRCLGKPQATVRVQRGCPFPCSYCLVHTVSGKIARHRSPESILAEIRQLLEAGVRHFYFRAETFSLNKKWALALCALLEREAPQVRWVTTTRVDCVDAEVLAAMRAAGCYGVSFGIDTSSELIGRMVSKPPKRDEARAALRVCDEVGILSLGYFMIGFIWDTPETLAETRDFIRDVCPDLLTIHFAHPYPGTRYYEALKSMGAPQVVSLKAQAEPALSLQQLGVSELNAFARQILREHYFRPKVWWSLLKKGIRIGVS